MKQLRVGRSVVGFCLVGLFAAICNGQGNVNLRYCETETDYKDVGKTCYVDGRNGNDVNNGLSQTSAVRSQAAIPAGCKVILYKRGSVFHEKLALKSSAVVYAHYGDPAEPLPRFIVPGEPMSGPVIQALMRSGLTFDGLYLAGARGDGTMDNLMGGICVMLGPDSKLLNCEITSCDIGAMMSGEGSLARGNYIHDLIMGVDSAPGVDPNLVGGAEGIFVNASGCEVAYNSFVNCTGPAEWVGENGDCDGGATEVTVSAGKVLSGVKIHHNFSLNNCGFFEVASWFGESKGTFANSEFYSNLIINSGWMGLLQVNNTNLENIRYHHNTLVQHKGSLNNGILWIIFTQTSSGMSGGRLEPGTVFLTNNLYVLDSVRAFGTLIDSNFVQSGNMIVKTENKDPGFVKGNGAGASDYDLTAASPARAAGSGIPNEILDFFNRPVGNTLKPDVGAFQYGTLQSDCIPRLPLFDREGGGATGIRFIMSRGVMPSADNAVTVKFNSVSGILTSTRRSGSDREGRIAVYNIQGKKIYDVSYEEKTLSHRMDISSVVSGMYIIRISEGDYWLTKQIVKR